MSAADKNQLPIHHLSASQGGPLHIRDISHRNEYDFTTRHRHSYYEILFFEKGGGRQLVDFTQYTVQDHACYLVHPNQIHLLDRAAESRGRLIQFRSESVISSEALNALRQWVWEDASAVVFENDPQRFAQFSALLDGFRTENKGRYSLERDLHLLQVLLFDLLATDRSTEQKGDADADLTRFLQLVDAHFKEQHSVQFYLHALGLNEKKLAQLTRKYVGESPLQVIHQRLLLEIKRLLLFGQDSQKEIAYAMGFDSPSSFSAFVKNKSGQTPTELQVSLAEIHK